MGALLALLLTMPLAGGLVGPGVRSDATIPSGAITTAVPPPHSAAAAGTPLGSNGSSVWSRLPSLPANVSRFSMTYDAADETVLVFGGLLQGGYAVNYTWTFSNGTWTNLTPKLAVAPSPRYGMELAYDSSDGYVVGYGGDALTSSCSGSVSTYCNDTWIFQNGRWSQITPRCYFPGLGYASCSTYPGIPSGEYWANTLVNDPQNGYVLLYTCGLCSGTDSGADWTYHRGVWTDLVYNYSTNRTYYAPTIGAIAYDAQGGYVLGFGGGGDEPYYTTGGWGNLTYRWMNGTWLNESANLTVSPGPRFGEALAADPATGGVLLYGGWNYSCQVWANGYNYCQTGTTYYLNDTWEFVNGSWAEQATSLNPGLRDSPAVSDPPNGGVVLVGGYACAAVCPSTPRIINDTWFWGATPPLADLSLAAAPTATDTGRSIAFTASFLGGTAPTTVQWDFGDGNTATGASVSHAYGSAGLYTITAWVNDSANHSLTRQINVTITAALSLSPAAYPNPVDTGVPVELSAGPSGGVLPIHYAWSFGDGATVGLNSSPVSHAYSAQGSYTVTVNATDSAGAAVNASFSVSVNPPPRVVVLNATPAAVVLGRPVNFTAAVAGGTLPYTFAWNFGDGGLGGNLSNITHIYTTNGPFVATLSVTDAGGGRVVGSLNVTVALNASVLANGSFGAAPLVLAFQANATGGVPAYAYQWTFGDGLQSTLADPTHTFGIAGTYNVTLVVRDLAGHSARATRLVQVYPGGGPLGLEIGVSRPALSPGETTNVTAIPHGGYGRYTLTWTAVPGGCRVTSEVALQCTAGPNGTYAVSATLTDARGTIITAQASFGVGTSIGGLKPLTGNPWESPLALGLLAAVAAAVLIGGGVYANRSRRPPPGGPGARPGDRYAAYRAPGGGPREPPPPNGLDPLDDIF